VSIDIRDLNRIERRSVQPGSDGQSMPHFILTLASSGDGIPAWGTAPVVRDRALREFWPTEPWLASAVASLAARNGAFSWTLEGPPRTCARIQESLHLSDFGAGWVSFIERVSCDLYTQDNGAFIEVIRDGAGPSAPFLGLAHLDSGRCVRTGNREFPVLYTDQENQQHKMAWWQVIPFTDFPSPVETMNGVGLCAVSRILRAAQILRDTQIYNLEKVGGRNPGALHIVSGVGTQLLEDTLKQAAGNANDKGLLRFQLPAVLGTLDPTATVSVATILLKSLPDGFDVEKDMKWYIALLALAFGCEYQDLAPLPGGGLGTSQQSEILHLKARGKGPELFQKLVEHSFNFQVLPQNVTFKFNEKDLEAMKADAGVRFLRAQTREKDVTSGVTTPEVERQRMLEDGELTDELVAMMGDADVTRDDTMQDDERHQEDEPNVPIVEPQPPTPAQNQQVTDRLSKELSDDDYWAKRRTVLEHEYEQEMAAILSDVQDKVNKRIRREIHAIA